MSNIVREEGEQDAISRNVLACTGGITATLKQHWGLNHVWNEIITPRFERLNVLTNSKLYGDWTTKDGKRVFQIQMPLEVQRGFDKKRIDHRHHALDAIIVACATRNHINYLNNETALGKHTRDEKDKKRYDLRNKICFKKYNDETKQNYSWIFHKPWETFTQDSRAMLESIVVSFKQNLRVLKKATNYYQTWRPNNEGQLVKVTIKQTEGDFWAIRKSLHADTVSGQVRLKRKKTVSLMTALDEWEMIVDKEIRKREKDLFDLHPDKKKVKKLFTEQYPELSKIEIYYWNEDVAASRTTLNEKFDPDWIESITDTGIQKILDRHLQVHRESNSPGGHPFSPEGLDLLHQNMLALNDEKQHKPILKVRTSEPLGNKFRVGQTGNKKDKYVEADKGTNLFFAIYTDDKQNRQYETIPLNIVIERLKQKLLPVPEINEKGNALLFHLSPNDLVYVPTTDDKNINKGSRTKIDPRRIYKMVSSSGPQCFFIRHDIAIPAVNKVEFTSSNKMEKSIEGVMIKEVCSKLRVDRLGNVSLTV
jgi:CRISPR-associated endonuclease Csn1